MGFGHTSDDEFVEWISLQLHWAREGLRRRRILRKLRQQVLRCQLVPAHRLEWSARRTAVEGTARALSTVEAPLSGEPVIGYRVVVRIHFAARNRLAIAVDHHHLEDFEVEGLQGNARILGQRPLILARPRPRDADTFLFQDLKRSEVVSLVELYGVTVPELQVAPQVRCDEHLIRPGDPVTCVGMPEEHLDRTGSAGFRQTPVSVAVAAPAEARLIAADCDLRRLRDEVKERLVLEMVPDGV